MPQNLAKAPEIARLAKRCRENPYLYLTRDEIRSLFNFGEKSMRRLVELGAPVVAEKVNPDHLKAWLWENRQQIGKLTE